MTRTDLVDNDAEVVGSRQSQETSWAVGPGDGERRGLWPELGEEEKCSKAAEVAGVLV